MPSLLGFAPLTQVEIGGENLEPHRHHVLRAEEANLEQSAHKHHKCHLVACPVVDAGPIPEGIDQIGGQLHRSGHVFAGRMKALGQQAAHRGLHLVEPVPEGGVAVPDRLQHLGRGCGVGLVAEDRQQVKQLLTGWGEIYRLADLTALDAVPNGHYETCNTQILYKWLNTFPPDPHRSTVPR